LDDLFIYSYILQIANNGNIPGLRNNAGYYLTNSN